MAQTYNRAPRRANHDKEIFSHALRNNPMLSAASGGAIIAGSCTTLGNTLVMCLLTAALMPLIGYISAREAERISPQRRRAFYCAAAALVVFVLSLIFDSIVLGCVEAVGVFAPLLAVNPLILSRTAPGAPILTRREAVFEGLACALAFALVALPVGLIRELLGKGELLGIWMGFAGNEIFSRPFFGFILCGLALAFLRRVTAKPEHTRRGEEEQK